MFDSNYLKLAAAAVEKARKPPTVAESMPAVEKALEKVAIETGQIDFIVNTAAVLIKKPLKHMTHKEI